MPRIIQWSHLIAAVTALFVISPSVAAALPVCPPPPQPVSWNGSPPIYIERDIESCRRFSSNLTYDLTTGTYAFVWLEMTEARIQPFLDAGFHIMYTDRRLSREKLQVLEYFNTMLDHYFLATDREAVLIERGEAGPGWVRTGHVFAVRTAGSSPISAPVYRFYGSMSPGPNSHFFTIDRDEYLALQYSNSITPSYLPRWNSEGVLFNAFPLSECGTGKVPVWRAYNGGSTRGVESNHRYSTDKGVIDGMVTQGWIAEGIAFCVDAN